MWFCTQAMVLSALSMNAVDIPLPRITVRGGRFVESVTGREFRPRGFNYIRIRRQQSGGLWHDTFNPATYDGERAGRALADMARRGFNTVRVFVDHERGAGVAAPAGRRGLSDAYMDRVVDFLGRATAAGIHVVFAMLYTPDNEKYTEMAAQAPRLVEGPNAPWFNAGHVLARATYMADFAQAIKERRPTLMTSVLSLETENEAHLIATAPPFSNKAGLFDFDRRQFNLALQEDLQQLADDACIAATNKWVDAVQKVDRAALVSVNVFTFRAVGRSGPKALRADKTGDPRFPMRALAAVKSRASYVDIHFYPENDSTLDKDFASIELDVVRAEAEKRAKPLLVGEIGAFKPFWKTMPEAVGAMERSLAKVLQAGFRGFLYWTYDTDEQSDQIWHASEQNGAMADALSRCAK